MKSSFLLSINVEQTTPKFSAWTKTILLHLLSFVGWEFKQVLVAWLLCFHPRFVAHTQWHSAGGWAGLCGRYKRELQSHAGHFGSWWQEGWAQWGLSPRVPRYSLANMAASRWLGFLEVRVLRINCATQSLITKNTRAGSFFYWSTALFQRLSKDMPW